MLPDAYGCAVANRFGYLLDDDADPFDLMSEAEMAKEEEKKKKKKKEEEEEKEKEKQRAKQRRPGQRESQRDRRLHFASSDEPNPVPVRKWQPARPGPAAEGREEGQSATKRAAFGEQKAIQDKSPQEFSIPKPDSDVRPRGRIGGRRGGGGYTRTSDNFNLRGKGEYDRHNGTGISPEEKRGGRGPWNWGCADEAAGELMEVTSDVPIKSEEPQMPVEEENQNRATIEDGDVVVQVAMEMSLDEWKALQEIRRPKAEFNIRKAENKIPSKAKVIHQSKHREKLKGAMEGMEDDRSFFCKSVNDITSLLDINFGSLGRPSRGGRGRATQGRPTSRTERAKPVLERVDDNAPNPDDPEDFPALSAGR